MKALFTIWICSIAVAAAAFGQNPAPTQAASPAPTTSIAPTPAASISPSGALADKIQQRIDKKFKKHPGATAEDRDVENFDLGKRMAIPIVAIVFITLFGAPVLIVAVIMYFGFSKSRMLHRTVRMMIEKGQPVPAALLNPPPPQRQRSDMRRGVVLVMAGLGLMVFLGAASDWEGGAWSIGIIPFLIGAGYLLVWRLERRKNDNPPPAT
jgi:hypothetical protein